jgi:hypothetical protein
MAEKIKLDDDAMERALEMGLDAVDDEAVVEAAVAMDKLAKAAATAMEPALNALARLAKVTEGKTIRDLMYAAIPQETWEEWAETAQIAAQKTREHNRDMRRSAVYAVEYVWDLLADFTDDYGTAFAEVGAVQWALEVERDAGDNLATDLLTSNQWGLETRKGLFVLRLREHVAAMRIAVGMGADADLPETEEDAMRAAAVDGDPLLWLDEAFAVYLDGMGKTDQKEAAVVREKARRRWGAHRQPTRDGEPENGRLLALWLDIEATEQVELFPFLQWLALAVWRSVVREELAARAFAPSVVVVQGAQYTKLPKATGAISWGFGGMGVCVDDDRFTAQPSAPRVRVVPNSWSIVQAAEMQRRPHQTLLALEFPGNTPLTLAMVGQPGTVIRAPGGKLLVLMLATAHGGDMTKGSLKELARYLYPGSRIQRSHLEQVAKVLTSAGDLCAVLPDGTAIRCFDVRWPAVGVDPDQTVGWGLGRFFLDMAHKATAKAHGLGHLHGEFVVNLTGIMRLPRRHSLLRNYIQAGALWNDAHTPKRPGEFNPDYLERYTIEQWAAMVNTLSIGAVAYRTGKRGRRQSLADDKRATRKDLEDLHDLGMIRLERGGRSGEITLLPPGDLLEARRLIRGGAARPKKPKK